MFERNRTVLSDVFSEYGLPLKIQVTTMLCALKANRYKNKFPFYRV